jgi:hypothetical protein
MGDHINGRDKAHDPTGVWLLNTSLVPPPTSMPVFFVIVFHQGGTVTQDVQGESAFDPAAVNPPKPPFNVIFTPQGGVWQKTGWNTFSTTLLSIEYQIITSPEPASPVFSFDITQYTGRLNASGDKMELSARITSFDPNGKETGSLTFNANGVRIPLKVLPNTIHTLPIPPIPTAPVP